MKPDDLTYATFAARLHETFTVRPDPAAAAIALTLVAASEHAPPSAGERFSIIFRGPRASPLAQGTYPFEHPGLGVFPLFIVPIGAAQEEIRYEAVFTRLPRTEESTP